VFKFDNFSNKYFLAKFSPNAKNQINKKYFITYFLFLEKKNQNLKKKEGNFLPHFYLDFRGREEGGIFVLTSKVFGQLVHICRHLMLNPSWNAHIQPNITKLKKKTLQFAKLDMSSHN